MERQYMFTERLVGGAVQQLFSLTLLNTGTTPGAAYGYVRSIRPRVLLASSQWRACSRLLSSQGEGICSIISWKIIDFLTQDETKQDTGLSDDSTFVVVTELDFDGYDVGCETGVVDDKMCGELSLAYRVQFASRAAISRLSCLWL
ncbi:phosphatidylglycerophosphate phosphatase PTPMT1-like isoform X2 [Manihot esculenta]|nr:phosphatidylglycerophosphate phosphatase PTPMT1-like isoform X2 [Manihot esculenta]